MSRRWAMVAVATAVWAVALWPLPLAVWVRVLAPLRGVPEAGLVAAFGTAWAAWWHGRGWLPWRTLPAVWAAGVRLREVWGGGAVAMAALWAAQVRAGVRPTGTGYGGPARAGQGQHGTARWRTPREIANTLAVWRAGAQRQPSGVYVGQRGAAEAWVHCGEEHVLLIGSTGSRKSRGIILPSIAVLGGARASSMVVTDPKGELYAHTAAWLERQGYRVLRFDLREPARGLRWDPMAGVKAALDAGDLDRASAAAWDISHILVHSVEFTGGDPLWPQSQEALIAALILAVAAGEPPGAADDPALAGWEWPGPEARTMATVYASLLAGGAGGTVLDDWLGAFPPSHPARMAFGPVALSVDRTRASILTGAASELRLFADTEIAWLTSGHELDPAAVGHELTALFLVIPDERSTRYPLATLLIQQTLQALAAEADKNGGKLATPVTFLLDEFGNLPQIRDFDKTVTVARSRGIRLVLALQDLQQLKRHYRDAYGTIKGNLNLWLYLRTADLDTAKEVSERLGRYTTESMSVSAPHVTIFTSAPTVGPASEAHALQARELLTAEEVLRWPPDAGRAEVILMQSGRLPARLPVPDLSAWAGVWPAVQRPAPAPLARVMEAAAVWVPSAPPEAEEAGEGLPLAEALGEGDDDTPYDG